MAIESVVMGDVCVTADTTVFSTMAQFKLAPFETKRVPDGDIEQTVRYYDLKTDAAGAAVAYWLANRRDRTGIVAASLAIIAAARVA